MSYTPKNILVTGGAGFIGANFIEYMLRAHTDIKIVNLDKLTYAASLSHLKNVEQHPHYNFIKGDISDAALVNKIMLEHNIDTIVHFAAESHVDRSISGPAEFIQTNIVGTFTLLEAARKIWLQEQKRDSSNCRFHHISTDEVYGSLSETDPGFTEKTPYDPSSPYSASKASSDHLVRAYHHTYGLPITLSNCSNNYGPYQHTEKLIPMIISRCIEKKPIIIFGTGKNIRDWLFVKDHCQAIDVILKQGKVGDSYNIGGNEEHNNLDIVERICHIYAELTNTELADLLNLVQFGPDRLGHDFRYAIDATKIKTELQWAPSYTLNEGLNETVKHYLSK